MVITVVLRLDNLQSTPGLRVQSSAMPVVAARACEHVALLDTSETLGVQLDQVDPSLRGEIDYEPLKLPGGPDDPFCLRGLVVLSVVAVVRYRRGGRGQG